jgi:hypothetical protein
VGNKDNRHFTGFGGPGGEGGVREGYKWESDSLAQAKYDAPQETQATRATEGRLARIRRVLRHLISDV